MTPMPIVLLLIKFVLRHAPHVCMAVPVQPSSENSPFKGQDLQRISRQSCHTDQPTAPDRVQISRMASPIALEIGRSPY